MTAHPEPEERLRALLDEFGVAAQRYGHASRVYPRSGVLLTAESNLAATREDVGDAILALLNEVQRLRAALAEAEQELGRFMPVDDTKFVQRAKQDDTPR